MNKLSSARLAAVGVAMALAVALPAAPASAENSIEITTVGSAELTVDYACDASAGVVEIKAMVGDLNADSPSATGTQTDVTCEGSRHSATIALDGEQPSAGQTVQVRVALVDGDGNVVTGQARMVTLG
ncbi:hypothetical protein [Streptomyces anulatus]|uniref:Uncharacterized protein n=1 Tax=Streptomyces anulatus TaxID=1892 RepID=A0ABZ1ZWD2_STRAQ|nr:hypothetical protein [Streptomyces anulatus]WST82987.1 hypothetical protein OG238_00720 [Streptomyces anulatus]